MPASLLAAPLAAYGVRVHLVDPGWAPTAAFFRIGHLQPRWAHVVAVASAASELSNELDPGDCPLVIEAAWLHDIGYAPELHDTGSHAIDGARYLRAIGASPRLCALVANHTHAWVEADARGLGGILAAEFPREESAVADALTYADLVTGPTGARVTPRERLAEILDRYDVDHVVHRSITAATPELLAVAARVEARRTLV